MNESSSQQFEPIICNLKPAGHTTKTHKFPISVKSAYLPP